ncbi:MAG: hypothetical protein H7257_08120 [Taibaiella sp.]|nr:hypothetical protein [Taibaiella sp.]
MTLQQQKAYKLYQTGTFTLNAIAEELNINVLTLDAWIKDFSWTAPNAGTDTYDAIAANICRQLLEFQNHIAAREPGLRFPDGKEVEIMRKLIACLDKIKKIAAPAIAPPVKGSGNSNVRSSGLKPAKELHAKNTFIASPQTLPTTQHGQTSSNSATPVHHHESGTGRYEHIIPAGIEQTFHLAPPVSLGDFDKYGKLVWNWTPAYNKNFYFRGKDVCSKWLQYNLFQWCLFPHERRFIHNEKDYERLINHNDTYAAINRYITAYGRRPPSRAA